ncbi:hypothetical protein BDV59DRAFT_61284 [Aspergillus ambiguus]|uniref:uncharacterized protein n=1 Tax=Aspergillus ambiguus TaxID=176160 RepID=UPI003CCD57BA
MPTNISQGKDTRLAFLTGIFRPSYRYFGGRTLSSIFRDFPSKHSFTAYGTMDSFAKFPSEKIHLYTKVQEIQRCGKNGKHNYRLLISDGRQLYFNRVVFAIDSREILNILRLNVDPDEKEILRDLCTVRNIAVLHSDHSLASDIDHSWPACNYVVSPTKTCDQQSRDHLSDSRPLRSCLTYNVNALQDIPACLFGRVFITVNPLTPPHPRLVHGVWEFTDPGPTPAALYAQSCLPSIQNTRGLSYGFRWMGRGFLEDSVSAGLEIAIDHFGAKLPFKFSHPTDPMDSTDTQRLSMSDHLVRIVLSLAQTYVLLCEICWFWLRNTWARSGS